MELDLWNTCSKRPMSRWSDWHGRPIYAYHQHTTNILSESFKPNFQSLLPINYLWYFKKNWRKSSDDNFFNSFQTKIDHQKLSKLEFLLTWNICRWNTGYYYQPISVNPIEVLEMFRRQCTADYSSTFLHILWSFVVFL